MTVRSAPILEKTYDPSAVEAQMYAMWESAGAFVAHPDGLPHEKTFCIVIPPPNVTGALHLGHALNNTLQDVLVRWHRMRGFNTLWQPGTDHAGIATQAVVEKRIREQEGLTRHQLGATPQEARENLVARIWQWKDEYEKRILSQLKMMGCSCDWSRNRFTLDDGLSRAVRHIFFNLFRDGLIFRGKRLVNWDTQLQTAVSDDEVYHEAIRGHFYHIRYPVLATRQRSTGNRPQEKKTEGQDCESAVEPEFVIIATTRPETMLGDVAVAVHPDPEGALARAEEKARREYEHGPASGRVEACKQLERIAERRATHLPILRTLSGMARAGRKLLLPLVNREIPLICDELADPMLGTGCVKITPAHDPNDYEVGVRHKLPMINVLTPDGKIARIIEPDGSTNPHSSEYEGLEFSTAGRRKVVADLEARGLLEKIEDRDIDLAHSDRSKTPIEPFLSDQWFVRTGDTGTEEKPQATGHRPYLEGMEAKRHKGTEAHPSELRPSDGGFLRRGLAQDAMDEVLEGRIQVFPSRYAKSYLDWLGEKRDWCISRQLWWGHRIPVWTAPFAYQAGNQERDSFERVQAHMEESGGRPLTEAERNSVHVHTLPDTSGGTGRMIVCVAPGHPEIEESLNRSAFVQDSDVLDTWFSSALWPFSTLGWPENNEYLKQYYPTTVLCTSRDIITNWVARMVMFGLYAMGRKPFDHVYIHPKILDGRGETMSKSKGNGVDPVDIIHTHGADALRYTMVDMTTETQDIRMPVEYVCPHCAKLTDQSQALKAEEQNRKSRGIRLDRPLQPSDVQRVRCSHKECGMDFATQWADANTKQQLGLGRETSEKFDIGRNFCNKMWNAARFAFMNLEGTPYQRIEPSELLPEDRWILARLSQTCRRVHELLSQYQFSATVKELRDFFWDSLCDWYIELTKGRMNGPRGSSRADVESQDLSGANLRGDLTSTCPIPSAQNEDRGSRIARQVLAFCLDQTLRLFHPIIPFITERLWQQLNQIVPRRGLPGLADLPDASLPEHGRERLLVTAAYPPAGGYPELERSIHATAIIDIFADIQNVVRAVRDLRAKCNVPPKQAVSAVIVLPPERADAFRSQMHIVQRMAGVQEVTIAAPGSPQAVRPRDAGAIRVGAVRVFVPGISNDAVEKARASRELAEVDKQLKSRQAKLSNEKFVANADPELVESERRRVEELTHHRAALEETLADLG